MLRYAPAFSLANFFMGSPFLAAAKTADTKMLREKNTQAATAVAAKSTIAVERDGARDSKYAPTIAGPVMPA
jgi:hypothetical protein